MRKKNWKDGEDQVEVEREKIEVKEKRLCMTTTVDEMRLKNTLSHEVHVTQTSRERRRLRALSACSQVVQRVSVFVSLYLLLMWFVSCLSSLLVLLVVFDIEFP